MAAGLVRTHSSGAARFYQNFGRTLGRTLVSTDEMAMVVVAVAVATATQMVLATARVVMVEL